MKLTACINGEPILKEDREYVVMVCGGRDFTDYSLMMDTLEESIAERYEEIGERPIKIIQGGAEGADRLAKEIAEEYGIPCEEYEAEWNKVDTNRPCKIQSNKYGRPYNILAGFNRNLEMVQDCDLCIIFHDGKSKGTKDSLNKAIGLGKDYVYIKY